MNLESPPLLLPLLLLSLQLPPLASAQLCGADFGTVPVTAANKLLDTALKLILVDTSEKLDAGTVASFTLYNSGGPNPISLQIWRPVKTKTLQLVCETQATLKAGLQTIPASPPCEIENGDLLGWFQDTGAKAGGVSADKIIETPADMCSAVYHEMDGEDPVGVVWQYCGVPGHLQPGCPPVPVGGTFDVEGCGKRKYSIAVRVDGMCTACAWGCKVLAGLLLVSALYLGVGMGMAHRQGARGGWQELLPHKQQWKEVRALAADGLAFVRAGGKASRQASSVQQQQQQQPLVVSRRDSDTQEHGSSRGRGSSILNVALKGKKEANKGKKTKKSKKIGSDSHKDPALLAQGGGGGATSSALPPPPAAGSPEREWAPTRTGHLAVGARETGVKVIGT